MTALTTDEALARLLDEGRDRAAATDPDHARLWDALTAATEGGKRFRPALVTATHAALGGTCFAAAIQVGAAVELLHTAFVIHDDVIDGDDLRRGQLNVSGTFHAYALASGAAPRDAGTFGRTAGILAGDLALAAAIRTVATCGASVPVTRSLLDLFDATLHATAAGELADVRLAVSLEAASVLECLAMEEQKTSAYSFALPLQAGAILAGADQKTVRRLAAAGRTMGVAFQLFDDLLGVFGEPKQTGKSATSDLRERKQTPLLTHARATPEWDRIHTYVGRDLSTEELNEARRLLTISGSRAFVEELAQAHLATARSALEEVGIAPDLVAGCITHPRLLTVTDDVAA